MKKIITAALLGLSLNSFADSSPLWLRFCSIAPDGQTIAFSYKGDIFSVPVMVEQQNNLLLIQHTMLTPSGVPMDKKLLLLPHAKVVWISI